MPAKAEVVKIRLEFKKGSQTLNQCDPKTADEKLYEVAEAVAGLRKEEDVRFVKITEGRLLG